MRKRRANVWPPRRSVLTANITALTTRSRDSAPQRSMQDCTLDGASGAKPHGDENSGRCPVLWHGCAGLLVGDQREQSWESSAIRAWLSSGGCGVPVGPVETVGGGVKYAASRTPTATRSPCRR